MRVLSAADAIGPAIARTRQLLFGQRRWGTFFKVALVAVLAALGDGGLNTHFNSFSRHTSKPHLTPQMAAAVAAIVAFAALIAVLVAAVLLVFFYVGNRMQFVLFDMVLTLRTAIAPPWHLYGHRTWRWIGLKITLLLSFLLLMALISLPLILRFIHDYRSGVHFSPWNFVTLFIGSSLGLFVVFVLYFVVISLVRDFALPAVALEDARILPTLSRLLLFCRAEPGAVTLYLLLRFAVSIAVSIATVIVIVVAALVALLVFGLLGVVFYFALHHHGSAAMVVMYAAFAVLGLLFIAWIVMVETAIVGTVLTFQQAWALYFLGGRYTLLGDLLEPPVAYAPYAYPAPTPMPPPFMPPPPVSL